MLISVTGVRKRSCTFALQLGNISGWYSNHSKSHMAQTFSYQALTLTNVRGYESVITRPARMVFQLNLSPGHMSYKYMISIIM